MKHLFFGGIFIIVFFNQLSSTSPIHNNISAKISFCIADLKFDGKDFKICEFGEARFSTFKGLDYYFWDKFWHYLKQFNLPIWYVGRFYLPKFEEMRAYKSLVACGGEAYPSFNELEKNKFFKSLIGNGKISDPHQISNYKAIICPTRMNDSVKAFQKKYPNVLIVDEATASYVSSKIETVKLLNDHEFSTYCPKFKILKRLHAADITTYAQKAANSIINNFNGGYYVVKPARGTMGRGVFIVSKKELPDILTCTLQLYPGTPKNKTTNDPIEYWKQDDNNDCLVEEFIPSKIIKVGDKLYDATIRLIFALCYDNHTPKIELFGGYWKCPNVALNEEGDFTMRHKSGTPANVRVSIDQDDYNTVTEIFKDFMLRLYMKMLNHPITK